DVTARKQSEEALRVSEGKTRFLNAELQRKVDEIETLIDTAPVGIAVAADPDCRHIWANPTLARMLGTSVSQNIGVTAEGWKPADGGGVASSKLKVALSSPSPPSSFPLTADPSGEGGDGGEGQCVADNLQPETSSSLPFK